METQQHEKHQSFWLWVMCLTGVDYFSTLGYQPSIAFEATGRLAPLATVVLVALTLFGALPVYAYVAGQSPHGQGSIAMLERLVRGWHGKTLVLILLGFAATDFVITKTLSAADAAEHLINNSYWKQYMPPWEEHRERIIITMMLLVFLGSVFLRGFKEVIWMAVVIVAVYLTLNAIIIGSGLLYLCQHQEIVQTWWHQVQAGEWHLHERPFAGHEPWMIIAVCLLYFPKLALGLSGFETGVAVMPLIRGEKDDDPQLPRGRIRAARYLLITAALIMSVYLMGSSVVVSMLIEPEALVGQLDHAADAPRPDAKDRALAYLAHGESKYPLNPLFGGIFGTLYDLATVIVLGFAGASAMAGLLNLVPQYLPRYGMAPEWTRAFRPLVILFTVINLAVTYLFDASVSAQGGAYATGVLVLMSSACIATLIDTWRKRRGILRTCIPLLFAPITCVFLYTTAAIIIEKPDGIKIASFFIIFIFTSSLVSRMTRSTELRFIGFRFVDDQSKFLWQSLQHLEFPVLVPHRPGRIPLSRKEEIIRADHRLTPEIPIVFVESILGDASDFYQSPLMSITQEEGRFIVRIENCASIAHVIAAVGLELSRVGKPPEIHFGWSDESPLAASLSFIVFGEGNVPWMVRELINRAEHDLERRPRVFIG